MSTENVSQRIKKRKRNCADAAVSECKKYNVQRRASSSRHELHRQLNPTPMPVMDYLVEKKNKMLSKLTGCVYCGQRATTMDHFEPLVTDGMPTGLIPTELDVVPCCSWCNSSKGARSWKVHMKRVYDVKRCAKNHSSRVRTLSLYDTWRKSHAQRWDVASNAKRIEMLNLMVDDSHAFMQQQINKAVEAMHGSRAVVVHDRGTKMDWSDISSQLKPRRG